MRFGMPLKSNAGSSMISVMVALGIMGIAASGIVGWSSQKLKVNKQLNLHAVAEQIKQKLTGALISPTSWQITQSQNSRAFTDLEQIGSSASASYPLLKIFTTSTTKPYYDSTLETAGFDPHGNPCSWDNHFDPVNGNDACPFRYEIRLVRHVFQNGNWIDTIRFQLKFKPAKTSSLVLNAGSNTYSFELDRNFNEKSVESSCISLKGTYDARTGKCSTQITQEVVCSSGAKAFRGPANAGNTQTCSNVVAPPLSCGAGQILKGFDSQGHPRCVSAT